MLAPLVPYAVRGVLWYQGESITAPGELFPQWNATLIADWRKLWGRELPFYFFQLAALDQKSNTPKVRAWQAEALKLPNTAMVVTIDIGDVKDVHPHNKLDAGTRAARIALARDYGKPIEYRGPTFTTATVEKNAIRVRFDHAAGLATKDGGPPQTFEIAGADGNTCRPRRSWTAKRSSPAPPPCPSRPSFATRGRITRRASICRILQDCLARRSVRIRSR